MNAPARTAAALLLLALAAGCERLSSELTFYVPAGREASMERVAEILADQSHLTLQGMAETAELSPLEALQSGVVDLALVENSTPFTTGIRAVLPVYESVLHVLIRDGYQPVDPDNPTHGISIHVMNRSTAGYDFVRAVTRRQGLRPGDYRVTDSFVPGETDVIIFLGPVEPDYTPWFREGYSLVSLDNPHNSQGPFFLEGIKYVIPNMKPVELPPQTYFTVPGNRTALQTLAVDTLLVTRDDAPLPEIWELTRTLIEQKPRFVAGAPQLFSGIHEDFDPLDLSFPLHEGARRYLMRDEPSLLERYAESINLLLYLLVLLLTGLLGLARWRAQRKKDRIDRFYSRILAVRDRMDRDRPAALLEELNRLEREAFESLIAEKLAANESFLIFNDLLARLRSELQERETAGPEPREA